ncbi:MAG TPA: GGDEF domain-containing protein [Iamia sp.]|nr:GGDEF domain-containing protein [Iamia sp.]
MGAPDDREATGALVAAHRAQQREETRATTLVAGGVALVALPLWTVFDRILVPAQADAFLVTRLVVEAWILLVWLALWARPRGTARAEALSLLMVAGLAAGIAWMVPRSGERIEAYLLGLTLPLFATAFLLVWRWPMTVALSAATAAAIALSSLGAEPRPGAPEVTTIAFYLATASALAVTAQVYRERRSWQQHVTQTALEAERERNAVLVEELEQLSREDPLTSIGNRRAWDERLTGEVLRARRSDRPLSVLVVDLDHFKAVNDRAGHAVGDAVLRTASAVLAARSRATDFLARLGGDELAVLCPDTSLAAAAALATDIRDGIRATAFPAGITMTCSIGVAELERADANAEVLCHRADAALYDAKTVRDTVRCAEPGRAGRRDPIRPG